MRCVSYLVGTTTCSHGNALVIRSKILVMSPFLVFSNLAVQPKSMFSSIPPYQLTNHWHSQLAPLRTQYRLCILYSQSLLMTNLCLFCHYCPWALYSTLFLVQNCLKKKKLLSNTIQFFVFDNVPALNRPNRLLDITALSIGGLHAFFPLLFTQTFTRQASCSFLGHEQKVLLTSLKNTAVLASCLLARVKLI